MTEQPDNLERTRLRREPQRGSHDPSLIRDIIDTALVCHLGLTDHDGHPLVIPTIHARVDDVLYVHGSAAGRTLRRLATGIDACCTITLLDGIVIALPIDDSSAKVRTGHPNHDPADLDSSVWAGTVPLQIVAGAPLPSPNVPAGVSVPSSVRTLTSLLPPTVI
ncbi:MAG: hypothetical protein F2534_01725 [Actinobacteria bacterium]|uniref:Unannotated protein n=1 Tax=freshwater metagenome TaxID=449393 RepID=A0A6J6BRW6_9ZZZZ|nr:hypothetical protein [Actinomycetota bacterium]